jgi:hypothetical protein
MDNKVLKVKVKATNQVIAVYKLNDGRYNRYIGDNLSMENIKRDEHTQTFTKEELEIL